MLVVNKPANMLSQGDRTGDEDIQSLMKIWLKEKYQKPGNVFLGLVQRLDRPTGGLMVLARTSKSASRLSEQIRARSFKKEYLAIVVSRQVRTGIVSHDIFKNKEKRKAVISGTDPRTDESGDKKKAVMKVTHLETRGELSLVKIDLYTGRYHQIRAQLASMGMPVAGDRKYGTLRKGSKQLALFCHRLAFEHPTRKETLRFQIPMPKEYPWDQFATE